MNSGTPVESLASAVYTAISLPEVLPDVERTWRNESKKVRPSLEDLTIIHFKQLWSSTALGFGGIGGQAMTNAYTTVIICDGNAAVFFAGRHAYSVDNVDDKFMEDVNKRQMPSLPEAKKRY